MSILQQILTNAYANAYENAYDLILLKLFSTPKIYTSNDDPSKRWYIYFSFRNPKSGKMERQTPIYAGINKHKTVKERKEAAQNLKWAVDRILKNGFNPYENSKLDEIEKHYNIKEAFEFGLEIKKKTLSENSYSDYRIRIAKFQKWLIANGLDELLKIEHLTKKIVSTYLNEVLQKTSPINRNNTRAVISTFFKTLEDEDIIKDNFIKNIPILKSTPERNKTYSKELEGKIFEKLNDDPTLKLFVQFISYNFLRPVEVVRLKIKDINIEEQKLFVKAKNKTDKIKIIPEILLKELPEIKHLDQECFLFTPNGIAGEWETKETNRRDYFSKRFNEIIKKPLKLGKDYGLYSFRHTFITKLYKELAINSTPFEAKSKLMLITGHSTMTALDKYLRDIDAVLPEDYSSMLS
jgi:integrase